MAEENAATESTASRAAEDAQQAQPAADWEAKYKGAMEHARLWEDRAKANLEKAEADLERIKGERRREALVAEVASGKGVDAGLLAGMRAESREELEAAADAIAAAVGKSTAFPSVYDGGAAQAPAVSRESIESIRDPEQRIMARARNIGIYK